jgi:hypothetical protein
MITGGLKEELVATREHQQELLKVVEGMKQTNAVMREEQENYRRQSLSLQALQAQQEANFREAEAEAREKKQMLQTQQEANVREAKACEKKATVRKKPSNPSRRNSRVGGAASSTEMQQDTFFCIMGEGASEGEEQQVVVQSTGIYIKSLTREEELPWTEVRRWRLDPQLMGDQGAMFEFESASVRYPFRHPTTERAFAMLQLFQHHCTMHIGCFLLQEDGADEEDEETVLLLDRLGVSNSKVQNIMQSMRACAPPPTPTIRTVDNSLRGPSHA